MQRRDRRGRASLSSGRFPAFERCYLTYHTTHPGAYDARHIWPQRPGGSTYSDDCDHPFQGKATSRQRVSMLRASSVQSGRLAPVRHLGILLHTGRQQGRRRAVTATETRPQEPPQGRTPSATSSEPCPRTRAVSRFGRRLAHLRCRRGQARPRAYARQGPRRGSGRVPTETPSLPLGPGGPLPCAGQQEPGSRP